MRITTKVDANIRDLAMIGNDYRDWYFHSRDSIAEFCKATNNDRVFVTDIISIFSPRTQVSSNILFAKQYLENGKVSGCMQHRVTAADRYVQTGKYSGRKVLAFADNLLNPEYSQLVTVDTHIAKAYGIGSDFNDDQFVAICRHVTALAKYADLLPHQVQAAVWCGRFIRDLGREPETLLDFSPTHGVLA